MTQIEQDLYMAYWNTIRLNPMKCGNLTHTEHYMMSGELEYFKSHLSLRQRSNVFLKLKDDGNIKADPLNTHYWQAQPMAMKSTGAVFFECKDA